MKLPKEEKKHIVNEISKTFHDDPQWLGRGISQQDIDRETRRVLSNHGYRIV